MAASRTLREDSYLGACVIFLRYKLSVSTANKVVDTFILIILFSKSVRTDNSFIVVKATYSVKKMYF